MVTRIVGSYLSPYVRKALVLLDLKGVAYQIDPIVPFYGDDRFAALSPLRRVPVLIDDTVAISDSSVICQYLEDRYPAPALYPSDLAARARARWFEEYADTRMGDVFIWKLFNQVAIKRAVWGESTDQAALARTLAEEVPQVLDYLESEPPPKGYFAGDLSIADVAVACFCRNAELARFAIDAVRWPRMAEWSSRMLGSAPFKRLRGFEDLSFRTSIADHRAALLGAGAPISAETFGTANPRRGLMPPEGSCALRSCEIVHILCRRCEWA